MVNNVRDIETDRRAGKRTVAVRLGRLRARRLYAATIALAFLVTIVIVVTSGKPWMFLALLAAPMGPPLLRTVGTRTDGPSLNGALAGTGRLLAAFSLMLSAGLLLS